ncbi:MAG: sensor histidine kinase [Burkholderiales bacterium]|nr:sensor histidine kinase [Burkholderiales bacterium]MBH2016146.1 sensor histidine kinase [Burkholderiales bacterium]
MPPTPPQPAPPASPATPPSSREALALERLSAREVWSRSRRLLIAAFAVVAIVGVGVVSHQATWNQGLAEVRANANHRLDLFASALEGMLNRLEHVPATIQLNRDVVALLRPRSGPASADAVNGFLRQLNAQLGSMAVYVINERGRVVASSNADQADSFVGEDLAFRPYFIEALSGEVGRHFAIGNTSRQPGYYLANPIRDQGRVIGVAVIKISLAPVAQAWAMLGVPAFIVDDNQVIILSSQSDWLYQSLGEPGLERVVDFQIQQLYLEQRPPRFAASATLQAASGARPAEGVLLEGRQLGPKLGRSVLALSQPLPKMHWSLWVFTDVDPVRRQAVTVGMLSAVAAGFFGLLWVAIAQRQRIVRQKLAARSMLERVNAGLEAKVARRTSALAQTNERLRHEVAERIQAEHTLREAQDELVQAAKLAVVGQMSAGITHEITQPLGAIRTLAGNSQAFLARGDLDTVGSNLGVITRLTDQMGEIVQSLKGFARKAPPQPQATDVAQAVHNALLLFMARIRADDVTLVNGCQEGLAQAWCEPNRLEQVIVNLVGNALDALRGQPERTLHVHTALTPEGRVLLMVDDSGAGLSPELQERLFAPFFTTKPHGHGLGLGLPISRDIIRSFGGELRAENRPEGGARFTVDLPERHPHDTP